MTSSRHSMRRIFAITAVLVGLFLIHTSLSAQPGGTARDYFVTAEEEALSWQSDANLRYIAGVGEDLYLQGELLTWSYIFESNEADSLYMVVVALGLPVFSGAVYDTFSVLDPLPENWIDSDDAIAVAESNGGSDFRQNTGSDLIVASAGVGLYLPDLMRAVWLFTYTDTTNLIATTLIYVDAVTGEWIETQGLGVGDQPDGIATPKALSLSQNFPNPFNPSTTLRYSVPEGAAREVSLEIYTLRGRLVNTLFRGVRGPGSYLVHWDGRDDRGNVLGAGCYLAKLRSGRDLQVIKMSLVK